MAPETFVTCIVVPVVPQYVCDSGEIKLAFGSAIICMFCCAVFKQLCASVYEYVMVCVPTPAVDGVNVPVEETPFPEKVPPTGLTPLI